MFKNKKRKEKKERKRNCITTRKTLRYNDRINLKQHKNTTILSSTLSACIDTYTRILMHSH